MPFGPSTQRHQEPQQPRQNNRQQQEQFSAEAILATKNAGLPRDQRVSTQQLAGLMRLAVTHGRQNGYTFDYSSPLTPQERNIVNNMQAVETIPYKTTKELDRFITSQAQELGLTPEAMLRGMKSELHVGQSNVVMVGDFSSPLQINTADPHTRTTHDASGRTLMNANGINVIERNGIIEDTERGQINHRLASLQEINQHSEYYQNVDGVVITTGKDMTLNELMQYSRVQGLTLENLHSKREEILSGLETRQQELEKLVNDGYPGVPEDKKESVLSNYQELTEALDEIRQIQNIANPNGNLGIPVYLPEGNLNEGGEPRIKLSTLANTTLGPEDNIIVASGSDPNSGSIHSSLADAKAPGVLEVRHAYAQYAEVTYNENGTEAHIQPVSTAQLLGKIYSSMLEKGAVPRRDRDETTSRIQELSQMNERTNVAIPLQSELKGLLEELRTGNNKQQSVYEEFTRTHKLYPGGYSLNGDYIAEVPYGNFDQQNGQFLPPGVRVPVGQIFTTNESRALILPGADGNIIPSDQHPLRGSSFATFQIAAEREGKGAEEEPK